MTTYRCAACSTILETEKLDILNIIEVKPCEACLEAAEEAALDTVDVVDFAEKGVETERISSLRKLNIEELERENQSLREKVEDLQGRIVDIDRRKLLGEGDVL